MPSDGRPFVNLKCLIIRSLRAVNVCIPGRLPSLEELVVRAYHSSKLSFEDPVGAFSGLKTFYAISRPITANGLDMIRATSDALMVRGLTLTAGSGKDNGKEFNKHSKTCIYLRPVNACKLSIKELSDVALTLVRQCRCEACFDCLARAGVVDGWR